MTPAPDRAALRRYAEQMAGDPQADFESALGQDILDVLADLDAGKERAEACNGSCDIALARRQVGPDGIVPGNARECAELWEREASRLRAERDAALYSTEKVQEAAGALMAERDALRAAIEKAILTIEWHKSGIRSDFWSDLHAMLRAALAPRETP